MIVFVKIKWEIFWIWISSVKKEKIWVFIFGRGKEWIKDGFLRCGEGGNNGLINIKYMVFMWKEIIIINVYLFEINFYMVRILVFFLN